MDFDWGSPIGLGAFLAGLGVFFWGLGAGARKPKDDGRGEPKR